MHYTKICRSCGSEFTTQQKHFYLCFDCWRSSNHHISGGDDLATLRRENHALRAQNQALRAQVREMIEEMDDLVLNPIAADSDDPQIPDDMMKRLLLLVHPDRHGNSPASTTATQWLLSLRETNRL